ncbi:MAG: hypothetical protein IK010_02905 [Bacteroidales bacterium]|nr:hypothetical protein [Bacteroidales bacterium]
MKKNKTIFFILIALCFFASSCNKKYTYVEEIIDKDYFGGEERSTKKPETIWAKNDTSAYIEAFEKFKRSQYIYDRMVLDGIPYVDVPLGFNLYTKDGIDISNIEFVSRKWWEDFYTKMFNNLFDTNTSGHESNLGKIDSAKINELLPFFNIRKDEFAPDGRIWYTPKDAPQNVWVNGIYLYFMVIDGKAQNLRLKVQYYANDWLFLDRVYFSIDSNAYKYTPENVKRDNGRGGMIWEWFDEQVHRDDKPLLDALSNAKNAKMKFVGDKYHDIKNITEDQIISINRTLELYYLLGGTL